VQNFQKRVVDLSPSRNFTQFQKLNRPKRSLRGEAIVILKSTIFQGFFHGQPHDFFIFVATGGQICSNKLQTRVPLIISPHFKKTHLNQSLESEDITDLKSTIFFFGGGGGGCDGGGLQNS
jgi:hypothetical protein